MSLKVCIAPQAAKDFEGLPAANKVRVAVALLSMMEEGFAKIGPKMLRWSAENRFTLYLSRRPNHFDLQRGSEIHGVFDERFPGSVFITHVKMIQRKVKITSVKPHVTSLTSRKEKDVHADFLERCEEISRDWLQEVFDDPFNKRALADLSKPDTDIPLTRPMYIMGAFYNSVDQIHLDAAARKKHGIGPGCAFLQGECGVSRIEIDETVPDGRDILARRLTLLEKQEGVLLGVSLVDPLDPLSLAQRDLVRSAMFTAKLQFPETDIEVIEVIVRNSEGVAIHSSARAFLEHEGLLPRRSEQAKHATFTAFFRKARSERSGSQRAFPFRSEQRWFDIDIFENCGDETKGYMVDAQFQVNCLRGIGTILRAAGLASRDSAMIEVRDLSHLPKDQFWEIIQELSGYGALVIAPAAASQEDVELLLKECANAMLSGWLPFSAIILHGDVAEHQVVVPQGLKEDGPINVNFRESPGKVFDAIKTAYDVNPFLSVQCSGHISA
ncbi:hypothetical protein [Salipiger abyssi]|uniref:hypothetical protein n=1 Tax=Salipiger abyssi TaxID=1250539 RepID=UPI001A90A084|nr:hypothetical protein [Salipiger abyssi]MBN9890151.1 hypothetical protein [Salipiger abyssi]